MNYQINNKNDLENFVTHNWNKVNQYFDEKYSHIPVPFYNSVDIRESLNKFAPVDNNLYPAGFNNICTLDFNITAERIKKEVLALDKSTKKIALIPESHTKNLFYLDNLYSLYTLLSKYNFEVDIISLDEDLFEGSDELNLVSKSGFDIRILKAKFENDIYSKNGTYDLVVLNHDQSSPIEIDWKKIEKKVVPTPRLGWQVRTKGAHFLHYKTIADKFCEQFSIDPSLMQASFNVAENIDFSTKEGLEELAESVKSIQSEVGTDKKIFIKANQGTYGMGIMVVNGPDEILSMNRKKRNKMDVGKNKIKFTSVIVQEGVDTVLTHDGGPAEITIYLIGGKPVGGFLRANPLKDASGNLNARGMVYQKFCISEIHEGFDHKAKEGVYSTIARISTIAAGHEILNIQNQD